MISEHKVSFAFVDNGVYSMSSEGLQILEETWGQVSSCGTVTKDKTNDGKLYCLQ